MDTPRSRADSLYPPSNELFTWTLAWGPSLGVRCLELPLYTHVCVNFLLIGRHKPSSIGRKLFFSPWVVKSYLLSVLNFEWVMEPHNKGFIFAERLSCVSSIGNWNLVTKYFPLKRLSLCSQVIENGRHLVALSCSIKLVNAIVSAEKRETPITDVSHLYSLADEDVVYYHNMSLFMLYFSLMIQWNLRLTYQSNYKYYQEFMYSWYYPELM